MDQGVYQLENLTDAEVLKGKQKRYGMSLAKTLYFYQRVPDFELVDSAF